MPQVKRRVSKEHSASADRRLQKDFDRASKVSPRKARSPAPRSWAHRPSLRRRPRRPQVAAAPAQSPPPPLTLAAETAPGRGPGAGRQRALRLRLHGGRVQVARLRMHLRQPGLELPRPARVVRQLWRQQGPELITCCHEESSVAMAHAYFKAEGKPLAVMAHGTVGLQHASMAIYNAWCDRVPVYVILGNHADAAIRRGAEWYHGVQDAAGDGPRLHEVGRLPMVPGALRRVGGARVPDRLTPPMAPVVMVLDGGLQEHPISKDERLAIPKLSMPAAAGRAWRCGTGGANAGRRRIPGARRRQARANTQRDEAPRRARRDAAGGRHRSGQPHELPVAPPAQPDAARPRGRRRSRRHRGARARGLLGHRQCTARSAAPIHTPGGEARCEVDLDLNGRPLHSRQLSGLQAHAGSRSRDRGRWRSHAAGADRGRQAADDGRSAARSEERGAHLAQAAARRPKRRAPRPRTPGTRVR